MIGGRVLHQRFLAGRGSSPHREWARRHSEKFTPFSGATSPASQRIDAVRFVRFRSAMKPAGRPASFRNSSNAAHSV
jgi:hypothetical protein